MVKSTYFPPINEKQIQLVSKLYSQNPKFFEDENCPYDQATIDLFKAGSVDNKAVADSVLKDLTSDEATLEVYEGTDLSKLDVDEVISEVDDLWRQLKEQGNNMKGSDNASERNTYFRLSVTLLEKVMALKEKAFNQKKMFAFTQAVLTIMEEELGPDQRTAVMERLQAILDDPE